MKTILTLVSIFLAAVASVQAEALKPQQLDVLLKHYFGVQDALASDDFEAATRAAKPLTATARGFAEEAEATSLNELAEAAAKIVAAESIESARSDFETVSNQLIVLVEEVGVHKIDGLHRMYCPMAFEGRRADWLQEEAKLRNPYFGARMLSCGVEVENWPATASSSKGRDKSSKGMKNKEEKTAKSKKADGDA